MLPSTTEVLVVGAGPVGLTAGLLLRHHGREVTVIDAQRTGSNASRAAVVHARTLEVLEPYGVAPRLVRRGVHVPRFTVRDRDRILVPVPFGGLASEYPFTLMISQAETEAILLSRFEELGGTVLRPVTAERVQQDPDGVTAIVDGGHRIRAAYLVAADGMHSQMREQAGIAFTGDTRAESFSLADVRLGGGVPADEVTLYFSPAGMMVLAPLPDGKHRIVAAVDDAPVEPDAGFVQQLLDARGPSRTPAVVEEVLWGSRFRVHHRLADTYRAGRILLAGDAAHVHSPAGGQGMNLGIEEAVSLGASLGAVLAGASPAVLDAYATARRPIAARVVRLVGRLTALATAPSIIRPLRNTALSVLGRTPAVQRDLARRLAGLDRRMEGES